MVGDGMKEDGRVRRRGERLLERGLRMPVEREDLVDALRYLDQRFVAAPPEDRAAQLAADALALYDATLKANPFIHELACTKGCAYCCYNYVSATAPEVFLIARHVRGCMPEGALAGVMERLAPATALAPHERVGRRIACAFLDGSSCSVYALRPISCRVRATVKADLELCVREYEGGKEPVAQTNLHRLIGAHVTLLVQIVLGASGHATDTYELSGALLAALRAPEAESRWLGGEDVFASVLKDTVDPRHRALVGERAAALAQSRGTSADA
jgi:Fe-S-cluster containining protein